MKETIFEQVATAASVLKLDLSAEEFALFAEDQEFSETGLLPTKYGRNLPTPTAVGEVAARHPGRTYALGMFRDLLKVTGVEGGKS